MLLLYPRSGWRTLFAAGSFAALAAGCGGSADTAAVQTASLAAPQRAAALPDTQAADALMNFGEAGFAQLFPAHSPTGSYPPFTYRYYPATGMYLGVVTQATNAYTPGGVYVLGGPYGSPTYVGLLGQYVFAWDTPGANWDATPWQ